MTKEAVMKAKYINTLILVVVATGSVFATFIGDVSRGVEPLQTIFLGFVAAIITIQVLPAVLLLGCMIKGLLARPEKELAEEKVDR
jgi:threonine/homoserine/homoserine lactone efflux protein